jgi:hypothetical protein
VIRSIVIDLASTVLGLPLRQIGLALGFARVLLPVG